MASEKPEDAVGSTVVAMMNSAGEYLRQGLAASEVFEGDQPADPRERAIATYLRGLEVIREHNRRLEEITQYLERQTGRSSAGTR